MNTTPRGLFLSVAQLVVELIISRRANDTETNPASDPSCFQSSILATGTSSRARTAWLGRENRASPWQSFAMVSATVLTEVTKVGHVTGSGINQDRSL